MLPCLTLQLMLPRLTLCLALPMMQETPPQARIRPPSLHSREYNIQSCNQINFSRTFLCVITKK
jgi:hypothetical protein